MNDLPPWLAALAGLFGLLIGSFLNVCIYRLPNDISVVRPRSFCPACKAGIAWYDNLPLLSFALLGGRCRACGRRIGWRYPFVEALTAVLFAVTVLRFGFSPVALKWCVFDALMIVMFCTDLGERILPDVLTLGGAVVGLTFAVFAVDHWQALEDAAIGGAALALPSWALGAIYKRVRGRAGLGMGDVKLLLCMGVFLGWQSGLTALLIGCVSGSVIGIAYLLLTRRNASTYELPFGSFLCAGAVAATLMA